MFSFSFKTFAKSWSWEKHEIVYIFCFHTICDQIMPHTWIVPRLPRSSALNCFSSSSTSLVVICNATTPIAALFNTLPKAKLQPQYSSLVYRVPPRSSTPIGHPYSLIDLTTSRSISSSPPRPSLSHSCWSASAAEGLSSGSRWSRKVMKFFASSVIPRHRGPEKLKLPILIWTDMNRYEQFWSDREKWWRVTQELTAFDLDKNFMIIRSIKWRWAWEQHVDDHSNRPNIAFLLIAAIHHFGTNMIEDHTLGQQSSGPDIIHCSMHCSHWDSRIENARESKINLRVTIDETLLMQRVPILTEHPQIYRRRPNSLIYKIIISQLDHPHLRSRWQMRCWWQ